MPPPAAFKLEDHGEGRFSLEGVLGFPTATALMKSSQKLFGDHSSIEIDLAGVTQADSAGLALLIEWLSSARRAGKPMKFRNVPEPIQAIARISEIEDLLEARPPAPHP